jgi:DNA repair exonuclease SbcCD nuclease subunit
MTIAFFTDIHFGKSGNNREHNERCVRFVEWMLERCVVRGVKTLIFGGDWHDNRSTIGVETLAYSHEALALMSQFSDLDEYLIVGNHDMPYRDSRDFHSLTRLHGRNMTVVQDPMVVDDGKTKILLVPYLVEGDDLGKIARMAKDCEFVFGHFELPGFMMNERFAMPHVEGHLTGEELVGPRYVFSGHFHARQERVTRSGTKIVYAGNCFPHDFGDAGDTDRGVMFISAGGDPEYEAWPEQPTFHVIPVSRLADELPNLGPNSSVRATADVEISEDDRESLLSAAAELGIASIRIDASAAVDVEQQAWDGTTDVRGFVLSWLADERNADLLPADPAVASSVYMEVTR